MCGNEGREVFYGKLLSFPSMFLEQNTMEKGCRTCRRMGWEVWVGGSMNDHTAEWRQTSQVNYQKSIIKKVRFSYVMKTPAQVKDRSWGLVAIRKITGSEVLKARPKFITSSLMLRTSLVGCTGPSVTPLQSILSHLAEVGICLPFYRQAE